MPNSKQIVYLSQAQYAELIANGSITVDGVTVTYDENDIYVTPQAEPVTDVRVNGTSITANGVANIPAATSSTPGVIKVGGRATFISSDGTLGVNTPTSGNIKAGTEAQKVIPVYLQHESTFYGLAKVAGHDEASSTETVGTYTPEAKGAIQQMLGVSDLIATAENSLVASKAYAIGDIFIANGKLYKATAAIAADAAIIPVIEGEEIAGANCVETKVVEGFVKFTDYATANKGGVVIVGNAGGLYINPNNGVLQVSGAGRNNEIKNGSNLNKPIVPYTQDMATFYGLAKAAGADEKDSTLSVGQYTDTAKSAIRSMIGAENGDDIVKVQDTEPTTAATKIWLPETAPASVTVPTVAEMNAALAEKVGIEDYASTTTGGVVKVNLNNGTQMINGVITTVNASDAEIKSGASGYKMLSATNQHKATFYGLAKAAGDATQAASDNAVGTYTDDAKSAIRTMLGAVGSEDYASTSTAGVVKISSADGTTISADGTLKIGKSSTASIKVGSGTSVFLMPSQTDLISFYGLAKASGDTTQSASSNAVGVYTDNAKASIKAMLGIQDGSTGTVDVSGTTPTITAVENTRYVCGEVTSLNFTPAASGICIVRFTSGSSVTVLTLPSTVKFPEWFDPTTLETNTIYEICVTDGIYGAVMSWAQ